MCLGAIYWAHIDTIYYGNTKADAAAIGFDDHFIYKEIELPLDQRTITIKQILPQEAISVFKLWEYTSAKRGY
jgi:tRNA(Arg) A34 adenosine deaminase TadA